MRPSSLMRHLLGWVLGALLLVWVSFIVVGFRTGVHEADELTDGHLASVAALLLSQSPGEFIARREPAVSPLLDMKAHDYQRSLSIVVWDATGRELTRSGDAPSASFSTDEGFADLLLGQPPAPWRSYAQWDGPEHRRRVLVMLSLSERDDLAEDIALQMALPGLWLLPVIALALGLAIRRGLQPLHDLSREVHALDVTRADALKTRQPQLEFRSVIDAINTLLQRQHAALAREREVAAEFAHELRTPLASMALHARALRADLGAAEREASLLRLEREALRAGDVLNQLLSLARVSRAELAEQAQPLDLADLARRVVAEYAEAALHSGHELGFSGAPSVPWRGHAVLLEVALRNLIENALRHTRPGTVVEVEVGADGQPWIQVSDDAGPQRDGAAPAPPAASPQGLGLGHRVVEKIAAIHHGRFDKVMPPPAGFRTSYRITFLQPPAAPAVNTSTPREPAR